MPQFHAITTVVLSGATAPASAVPIAALGNVGIAVPETTSCALRLHGGATASDLYPVWDRRTPAGSGALFGLAIAAGSASAILGDLVDGYGWLKPVFSVAQADTRTLTIFGQIRR